MADIFAMLIGLVKLAISTLPTTMIRVTPIGMSIGATSHDTFHPRIIMAEESYTEGESSGNVIDQGRKSINLLGALKASTSKINKLSLASKIPASLSNVQLSLQ